ncbi:MAG: hypothetical protein LW847_08980 [Burkholderiales bacterium]|jgi:hypothetical protein|nr:hypothetical protein [Burkholderiales bacterium]
MALLRVLFIVAALTVAGLVAAYFATGERKFLRWALRVFVAAVGAGLLFFAVLIADRLLGG